MKHGPSPSWFNSFLVGEGFTQRYLATGDSKLAIPFAQLYPFAFPRPLLPFPLFSLFHTLTSCEVLGAYPLNETILFSPCPIIIWPEGPAPHGTAECLLFVQSL